MSSVGQDGGVPSDHAPDANRYSGVLSDEAIRREVQDGWLIVKETFYDANLYPASYDMTVASDCLITPDGTEVSPASDDTRPRRVVLSSGDTAVFSTVELFRMPPDIAGNITIKNSWAVEGLMLLSGLLIDPGYGHDETADDSRGCRLYLHVANIGRESIEIRPGRDPIARVQFLRISGEESPTRIKIKASAWKDQRQPSLGFLTDLKHLKETEIKELRESVEHTGTMVQQVVMLGFVVLGVTLIGVVLATVLAIVAK